MNVNIKLNVVNCDFIMPLYHVKQLDWHGIWQNSGTFINISWTQHEQNLTGFYCRPSYIRKWCRVCHSAILACYHFCIAADLQWNNSNQFWCWKCDFQTFGVMNMMVRSSVMSFFIGCQAQWRHRIDVMRWQRFKSKDLLNNYNQALRMERKCTILISRNICIIGLRFSSLISNHLILLYIYTCHWLPLDEPLWTN